MSSVPGRTLQRVRRLLPPPALARAGNQGDIDLQSIAGATATGTHGTGARFANLSARIVALRLVTATGDVLTVSEGSEDYLAARVSPGALRVVSQVTLQTVPLYTLIRRGERRALTKTLERLDEFVTTTDYFDFFLFPYGETALTRTTRRSTHEELTRPRSRCAFRPLTTPSCRPRRRATPVTSPCTGAADGIRNLLPCRRGDHGRLCRRPHWGKRHYLTAGTLRERYPEWDRFGAVRDRVDPAASTDRHRPDTYQHDHKHIPKSVVLWHNSNDAQIIAQCAMGDRRRELCASRHPIADIGRAQLEVCTA
jgi:hypothetical protein